MKRIFAFLAFIQFCIAISAQVAIGKNEAPVKSAVLELVASDKGLLLPRLTTVQREAIANPADGLCVYDTDENRIYHYNTTTTKWEKVGTETDINNGSGTNPNPGKTETVKNVIFMIGDGMSFAQVQAGFTTSNNYLHMTSFPYTGMAQTYCANSKTTDSAAAATAMSTGVKTNKYYVGKNPAGNDVENIMEIAKKNGLSTGLVVTNSVTNATPACYYAHNINRNNETQIAADFLKSDMDVCIGGGLGQFDSSLRSQIAAKGYHVITSTDYRDVLNSPSSKILALLASANMPKMSASRGNMLAECTTKALEILSKNDKGFFLMVEGSQIDLGGHDKDYSYMLAELKDFDAAVARAKEFAEKDGNTLVIVTGDHETGGLIIYGGEDDSSGKATSMSTYYSRTIVNGAHTRTLVPIFAYGPGGDNFVGFLNNTDYKAKLEKLLELK